MRPLVSILMPMYNAADCVGDAIRSLQAQTYTNWELIVIDDGSRDGGADIVRDFDDARLRLTVGQENRGLPARLNQAVSLAQGAFLARMDADDLAFPERLAEQVDFLLRYPLVDVVATDMLIVDAVGQPGGREKWRGASHEEVTAKPWAGFHFNHATWMGRAGWFRRYPYREDAVRTEDDDLMLRSYRHSRFHRMERVLYAYRVDGVTAGSAWTARRHFMRSLWRESLAQRNPRLLFGIPTQLVKSLAERGAELVGVRGWAQRHRKGAPVPEPVLERYRSLRQVLRAA
ncbi:MAG: glycosyltransferase [Rhodothermales bacterium]|nr:glycosyltransferase [Rhodothermales bacterium]